MALHHLSGDPQRQRQTSDDDQHQDRVHPELRVLEHTSRLLETAAGDSQQQHEVGAGQEHEQDCHQLDAQVLKPPDGVVVGGEAAAGHGGERMADGIEAGHPHQPVESCGCQGQHDIQREQRPGLLLHPWSHGLVLHTYLLRRQQVLAGDPHGRQQDHEHQDDAHAPQPLQQRSPQQDAVGQVLNRSVRTRAEHRCTGGGQAADALEECVRPRGQKAGEQERDGAQRPRHYPGKAHDQQPLSPEELRARLAARQPQEDRPHQPDTHGRPEAGDRGLVAFPERHAEWDRQGQREEKREASQKPRHLGQVHGGSVTPAAWSSRLCTRRPHLPAPWHGRFSRRG